MDSKFGTKLINTYIFVSYNRHNFFRNNPHKRKTNNVFRFQGIRPEFYYFLLLVASSGTHM